MFIAHFTMIILIKLIKWLSMQALPRKIIGETGLKIPSMLFHSLQGVAVLRSQRTNNAPFLSLTSRHFAVNCDSSVMMPLSGMMSVCSSDTAKISPEPASWYLAKLKACKAAKNAPWT